MGRMLKDGGEDLNPVFLHSLFRSGSTYFFRKFREDLTGYFCFQEPGNEILNHIKERPELLLDQPINIDEKLRHPILLKPYFYEFYLLKESLGDIFDERISYDGYFLGDEFPDWQYKYFQALLANSRGRPFLQCCRTSGRARALKNCFGGVHFYLWREPRNQWLSWMVDRYFQSALIQIFFADSIPKVIEFARLSCGLVEPLGKSVLERIERSKNTHLSPRKSYFLFYTLWLYSMIHASRSCDLVVSVDRLSSCEDTKKQVSREIESLGVGCLDFSDFSMPFVGIGGHEEKEIRGIEGLVHDLFLSCGYDKKELSMHVDECEVVRSALSKSLCARSPHYDLAMYYESVLSKYYLENKRLKAKESESAAFKAVRFFKRIKKIVNKYANRSPSEKVYERIYLDRICINYFLHENKNIRGIGRVSRSIFEKMKSLASEVDFDFEKDDEDIYFYPSIHSCPAVLPKRSVVLIHDTIPMNFPDLFPKQFIDWLSIYKPISRQADIIFTISEVSKRDIILNLDCDFENVFVVPNGAYKYAPECLAPLGGMLYPYVVYVGALDNHKNVDVIVDALEDERISDVHLVIVGAGGYKKFNASRSVKNRIHHFGRLSDFDLARVVSNAVALVHPSLYEGFGLTPVESAHFGTPSVVSARPAMTDILADAALFASPFDPAEWVEAILMIKDNEAFAKELSMRAKEVASKYTWDESVKRMLSVIYSKYRLSSD